MISMRSSLLPTAEKCERLFAFQWMHGKGLLEQYGFKNPKPRKMHVGSVVGSAAHEGVTWMFTQFKATGEWGSKVRADQASTFAASYVASQSREYGMTFDNTTRTASNAVTSAQGIVKEYHLKIVPSAEPEIIEGGHACQFVDQMTGANYEVTGTVDRFVIVGGVLRDLKTSPNLRSHYAQLGAYMDILEANGYDVKHAMIDHIPRTRPGRMQEPLKVVDIDKSLARTHSRTVHGKMNTSLAELVDRGDPGAFIANPSCDLCNPKFCGAYDTEFCRLGKEVNG